MSIGVVAGVVLGLCVLAVVASCEKPMPPLTAPAAPYPVGQIVFGQTLDWASGETTAQGMGWFARTQSGRVVGMTSAHFLEQSGPRLVKVAWQNPADWAKDEPAKDVSSATHSLGRPGDEGIYTNTKTDLRRDYIVFALDAPLAPNAACILTLDSRPEVLRGEGVWLPFPNWEGTNPARMMTGQVTKSREGFIEIEFEEAVDLMGHSGSPLISQQTGQVIGTLSRGGLRGGKTVVIAAPVTTLAAAIASAEQKNEVPALKDVVGGR